MGTFLAKERINKSNKSNKIPPSSSSTDIDKEKFRYIEGRRFNNFQTSKYVLPNDDEECDRLHMQHFLMRYAWQGNFASPVEQILTGVDSKVLDVGCGAGSWSFEMATIYPNAKIIGVDISPVQPSGIKPKNFTFFQADITDGLPFADETFDFVFQRFLVGSIPKEKWFSVIKELTRMLKPGGYLELVEFDVLAESLGPTSYIFSNAYIKDEIKNIHGGIAEGKLGLAYNDDMMRLYENVKVLLAPFMQVSHKEYDQMVKTTKEEWLERNSYTRFIRVHARKI
ncbi:17192_t:CDS:2 [Funneliformis caledonium]|uniref:17192_t:CDS:1 n=1 Tax=Funneliformis caledonium TaxID=1117310 RepID=A0A9N9FTI1_9GLOM|nr:17192_t:CDS:2 [Funneliformis caledonium]